MNDVASIETAYATLTPLLGRAAAGVFLISLFASGISSSVVGTMAGQVIMQGFVGWRIPLWLRRLVTMVPAVIVIVGGLDTTKVLILSQVVLSFALAAASHRLDDLHQQARAHGRVRQRPVPRRSPASSGRP